MTISKLQKNITIILVPLIIIAGIADARGFAVGEWRTAVAVGLAALIINVADSFLMPLIIRRLGDNPAVVHKMAAMSGVNAFIALISLYLVGIL